jgi:hypothetical protein
MACERCARRKLPCVIPPLWLPRRVRPKSEGDMILYNRPVCRACQGRPCTLSTTGRTQKNIFWTEWALPSGHKTLTMVQASDGKVRPMSDGAVMEFAGPTSVGDLRALHEKEDQGSENDTLSEKLKDWAARTASEGTRSKTVGRKRVGDTDRYRTGSKVPGKPFRVNVTPCLAFPNLSHMI